MSSRIFMLDILNKFLTKRGFKGPEQLDNEPTSDGSPTERETFERWREILKKEKLSIEDIEVFLQGQIGIIETKWKDFGTTNEKKAELIPYHTIYKTLEQAISAPRAERERLIENLTKLTQ